MRPEDLEYFRSVLKKMLEEIQREGDKTIEEMSSSEHHFPDPGDRASQESDQFFTLRLRDRERKLLKKIKEALQRIEDGTYGICEMCGEEIGIERLKARPVTTLCIKCKTKQEEQERLRGF